jgi:catechol 2,3-dioxygenase-like lactoylglutathione lyase family enzyme
MAITGTHMLFYTSEAEKLRAMLRDVFGFKYVDAGGGWLIFELPPSEIGVHPDEGPTFESGTRHQITFMCDDIHRTIVDLRANGVTVEGTPKDEGYGIVTTLKLPGGCDVMLYQPRHVIAAGMSNAKTSVRKKAPAKLAGKKKAGARSASAKNLRRDKPGRRAKTAGRRR